jgi:NhaP-type Na+/H+ or K+/H+ antiporter
MKTSAFNTPSLIVALAMLLGSLLQVFAYYLRLPGIVLFLATGVLLGPDVLNILRPEKLGHGLEAIVSFAVAIILFEGGLLLNLKSLRQSAAPVRRLVTIGAVITAVGASTLAHFLMGWQWQLSILFGTLVIVTGPTVISPLVRRIRLRQNLSTILEAEGIFIDAVGATLAIVVLQLVTAHAREWIVPGLMGLLLRFGIGGVIGFVAGLGWRIFLKKWEQTIPEGLSNILILSCVIALFELSNALISESGITAVIIMGLVVGTGQNPVIEELKHFKEQLSTLLISMLFLLLAANVRMAEIWGLGWQGFVVVLGLMLVIRPINVLVSTTNTGLTWKEKAFLSWLAPRGIVAAAVASLFAHKLAEANIAGGKSLTALVFLVIAATVTIQGLSGTWVAERLELRKPLKTGYLFLGANSLARLCASLLRDGGEDVVLVDSNPQISRAAEEAGFKVFYGNGLDDKVLQRTYADSRKACVGLTPNDSVNYLFANKVAGLSRTADILAGMNPGGRISEAMLSEQKALLLFGKRYRLQKWISRIDREMVEVESWDFLPDEPRHGMISIIKVEETLGLPMVLERKGTRSLVTERYLQEEGDRVWFLMYEASRQRTESWLAEHGWRRCVEPSSKDEGTEAG